MAQKIGRNDLCLCGSGKKFKHCCLVRKQSGQPMVQPQQPSLSLRREIDRILVQAEQKKARLFEVGVFLLFADETGDAWLLEVTDNDAVQIAMDGKSLGVEIEETSETISLDWSYTFSFKDKKLYLTSYKDKQELCLENAPASQINAAIRRIRKRYSPELLDKVHVSSSMH